MVLWTCRTCRTQPKWCVKNKYPSDPDIITSFMSRLHKLKDTVSCRVILESLHTKLPLMLRFLSDEDDDVSTEMLKSAHDYISLMKICVPITEQQQSTVRVCGVQVIQQS